MKKAAIGAGLEEKLLQQVESLKRRIEQLEQRSGTVDGAQPMHQAALSEPEINLRLTQFSIDNLSDAAYWVQPDASISYVNHAATRLLGYSKQELLSKRIYELNPDISEQVWPSIWQQLKDKGKRTFETHHRAKDGTVIPVEISANYLEYAGGAFSCAFARDIRDRKQMELRLRQAEKMEAIGQLAGGIAHDFNNQLMGIMGYADMLQRELREDSELSYLVHNILLAVTRSAELTAQLLAFSRQGKYVSEPVDLHQVIHEVANILTHSIDKKIVIRLALDAHRAITMGDSSQLQNALLNLALNARDAMPNGGTLSFSTQDIMLDASFQSEHAFQVSPGPHVKVTVTDSGVGMSLEVQRRLFEPFFTTKGEGKGTGLGLAAVYGTVKNHRGAIRVESTSGHGTVLEVFLPTGEEELPRSRRGELEAQKTQRAAHILVVEDEALLRDVARRMLESLGYMVTTFESGDHAVEYYRQAHARVDLVILDMVMPVMNGRETFRALQAINPQVKALLASGYSLDGDAQAIIDDGVLGFIQKPYGRNALAQHIDEVLGSPS